MPELDAEPLQCFFVESEIARRHHGMRCDEQRMAGRSGRTEVDEPIQFDGIRNEASDIGSKIDARNCWYVFKTSRWRPQASIKWNILKRSRDETANPGWHVSARPTYGSFEDFSLKNT